MATLYLVVRSTNNLPAGDYGVSEDFTVVYASFDKERAEQAQAEAEHRVEMHNIEVHEQLEKRVGRMEKGWAEHNTLPFNREATIERLERYGEVDTELRCAFNIVEVETDKVYDMDKEPSIGGSWYIE